MFYSSEECGVSFRFARASACLYRCHHATSWPVKDVVSHELSHNLENRLGGSTVLAMADLGHTFRHLIPYITHCSFTALLYSHDWPRVCKLPCPSRYTEADPRIVLPLPHPMLNAKPRTSSFTVRHRFLNYALKKLINQPINQIGRINQPITQIDQIKHPMNQIDHIYHPIHQIGQINQPISHIDTESTNRSGRPNISINKSDGTKQSTNKSDRPTQSTYISDRSNKWTNKSDRPNQLPNITDRPNLSTNKSLRPN